MADSKVYEIITDRIIKKLEAGTVPWRKPWTVANWPRNLITNRPYRGINVFLTASEGYGSPYWLSFKQVGELGGRVIKGQPGTYIIYYGEAKSKTDLDEDGKPKPYRFLRYTRVWNLEQTEGVKLPKGREIAEREDADPIEAAEAIVAGFPNPPVIKQNGTAAVYNWETDTISVPSRSHHHSTEEFYSTLFHELGHSTGHKKRLDREIKNAFGSHAYGREELTAEMTAAFLCGEAGIVPAVIDNNAAYIASWIKTIKEDTQAVVKAAAAAQRAADHILDRTNVLALAA